MNTSKNNFESQIKKQIDDRELAPSRDLWAEIELHNSQNTPKSNTNWYLIAACLLLTISMGTVLFFLNEEKTVIKTQTANKTDNPTVEENLIQFEIEKTPILVQNQNIQTKNKESLPLITEKHTVSPITVVEKIISPTTHQKNKKEILPELVNIQPEKIIASTDSAKIPIKKKKYVDPSTLLFSIEHKDIIEKTKEGSNVATINLDIK